MSPRAAWRLESLGFGDVYDYKAGKLDWMAAGLPTEGTNSQRPRVAQIARTDVPTCGLDEMLGEVHDRAARTGFEAAVVVNEERVVFGLLRKKELSGPRDHKIAQAMRPGPSTFRPYLSVEEMAHHMVEHNLESSPITTYDGRLVGLVLRSDAVRVAKEGK